jgi:hypothetical protein
VPTENQQDMSWRPSDALLIAGIPALLYLLTLTYQYAAATAFEIPTQTLSVTWTETFDIGIVLFLVIGVLFTLAFMIISLAYTFWPREKRNPSYFSAAKAVPYLLTLSLCIYFILANWNRMRLLGTFGLFVLGWFSGWASAWFFERESRIHRQLNENQAKHFSYGITALVWVASALVTSFVIGTTTQKYEKRYYVSQTAPNTVVLAIWGDTVVETTFDPTTKTTKNDFIITKISDRSPLKVRWEDIGPLHVDTSALSNTPAFPLSNTQTH